MTDFFYGAGTLFAKSIAIPFVRGVIDATEEEFAAELSSLLSSPLSFLGKLF